MIISVIALTISCSVLIAFGIMLTPTLRLYLCARRREAPVRLRTMLGLRLRGIRTEPILRALLRLHDAGITTVAVSSLTFHHLMGGDVNRVADTVIRQHGRGLLPDIEQILTDDLQGA